MWSFLALVRLGLPKWLHRRANAVNAVAITFSQAAAKDMGISALKRNYL